MTPNLITETLDGLVERVEAQLPGRVLDQLTTAVSVSERLGRLGDELVDHFVEVARGSGHSWAEIGTSLGVSRQAAQQRGGRIQPTVRDDAADSKPSPFAVWHLNNSDEIEVQVEPATAWHRLVSLDGFTVKELIEASRRLDDEHWFAGLVRNLQLVYMELGAELRSTATAVLMDSAGRTSSREVDVTIAKGQAVWRNNRAYWRDEAPPADPAFQEIVAAVGETVKRQRADSGQ